MRKGNACPPACFHMVVSVGWVMATVWISLAQVVPLIPCRSTLGPAFVATGSLVKIRNPAWSVEAKCRYLIPAFPASPPAGLHPLLWETEAPCRGPGTITYASRPKAPGPVPVIGGSCVLSVGQGAGTWMGMGRETCKQGVLPGTYKIILQRERIRRTERGMTGLLLDMLLIWRFWQRAGRRRGRLSGTRTRSQEPGV